MEKLSVIVPCYNEQEVLPLFYDAFREVADTLPLTWELWLIDDGSKDGTLSGIKALNERDERVHYVAFSRNFGKEAAMYAGLEHASGDYVAIMDADLQDPPALLPQMLRGVTEEGYDCVGSRRVTRKGEPPVRSWFARRFYALMNRISKTEIVDGARDFRLMRRSMVDAILRLCERERFSKGIFSWVGFRVKYLEYENVERAAGKTKWNFWKLLVYSLDGIMAFSTAPLALSSIMGLVVCAAAFVLFLFFLIKTLIFGDPVAGFPALMCVMLMLGGIQLLGIGILGQYLSKTYLEVKKRPIYIAREEK